MGKEARHVLLTSGPGGRSDLLIFNIVSYLAPFLSEHVWSPGQEPARLCCGYANAGVSAGSLNDESRSPKGPTRLVWLKEQAELARHRLIDCLEPPSGDVAELGSVVV